MLKEQLSPIESLSDQLSLYTRSQLLKAKTELAKRAKKNTVTSENANWAATSYTERFAVGGIHNLDALTHTLRKDFEWYSGEYAQGKVITWQDFVIDEFVGLIGDDQTYGKGIDDYAEGFARKLEAEGHFDKLIRAGIEEKKLKELKKWCLTAKKHDIFIWNSPPYEKDGHSYVFIYHKLAKNKARYCQMMCWPNEQQHIDYQATVSQLDYSKQTIVYDKNLKKEHQIINLFLTLSPSWSNPLLRHVWAKDTITTLQTELYQTQDSWKLKPHQMPEIDEAAFYKKRDFLFNLYLKTAAPLFQKLPKVKSLESPEWKKFSQSKEYKDLIKKLDIAFTMMADQPLRAWVEQTDQKPQLFFRRFKNKLQQLFTPNQLKISTMSDRETVEALSFLYQLKLDKLAGKKLSREDILRFNNLAPGLLEVSNKFMSIGQCGLGSLIPTHMTSELLSLTGPQIAHLRMVNLSIATPDQKNEHHQYLKNNFATEVTIHGKKFRIHKDWVSKYNNSTCPKLLDGTILGPCSDPSNPNQFFPLPDDYCITEEMYQQELANTDVAANFAGVEQDLLDSADTEQEKVTIKKLFAYLMKLLIPPSVSLEAILLDNTDYVKNTSGGNLTKISQRLKTSAKNAVTTLETIIKEFDTKTLSTLAKEM